HPRVVLPESGEERLRMVGFQPRGLVGGDGEGGTVGFAEAEAAKGLQGSPDRIHYVRRITPVQRSFAEIILHRRFGFLVAQLPAEFVSLGQSAAGKDIEGPQDLFME